MAAGDHHLRLGSYLGDVSALSFLPSSPRPLLLAGTGSELLVYDVDAARLVASFQVFDGVRVHGIQPRAPPNCSSGSPPADGLTVALFGERRVKLLRLRVEANDEGEAVGVRLELEQRLPGFDHWVLDACFLEVDGLLAVGLSDNSVALWDLTERVFVTRVNSPEKCLLYSMRMWGDSVKSLLVASGTILNEILIWKLVPGTLSSSLLCSEEVDAPDVENRENVYFGNQYMPVHIGRLKEHEGSIFRIAWSSDGSKFMSVSDDRSARMWMLSCQPQNFSNQAAKIDDVDIIPKLTLFGHSARIWDCCISDSVVITAGEDCTCCIWGMDGKLIKMFKEHIGRGLWRCLYDPSSLVLITAGFDSAIKVHHLCNSFFHDTVKENVVPDGLKYDAEVFEISSPTVLGQYGPLDSKSEYVRCLHFVQENVLYVATNNGYLHHAELSDTNDVRWTEVIQVTEKAPIICMDVITVYSDSSDKEDTVALGDGRGNVTIVRLTSANLEPKMDSSFTWSAEKDRQLLGLYWCKSLECSHIFTADPRGVLKLWNISTALFSNAHAIIATPEVSLVAVFESPFGARIMCLDVSLQDEILIAGDKKGNITAFPFHKTLATHDSSAAQQKIPLCDRFKGAHGISSVTSVHIITTSTSDHIEIHTTGGDGCICFFKYGKDVNNVEFVGMRQLKELGTIQSIYANHASDNQLVGSYVIGFTSADFVIWDLGNDAKMVQISCGGWRRPYSYYLGTVPEYQNCFAFVKDHSIHIRRHWAPAQDKKLLPQLLHTQFHGREVHSLCFIDPASYSHLENSTDLWIATGCEDGTVRLTGYSASNAGRWSLSKMLGEHVGGSAVRDTCFIAKTYTLIDKSSKSGDSSGNILVENKDTTFLLISVGSKQVLTTWILQARIAENGQVCSSGLDLDTKQSSECSGNGDSAVTFQWLSTHMPPKLTTNRMKAGHLEQTFEEGKERNSSVQPNLAIMDQMENDWRYLSVTAFLLKHPTTRLTVCFAIVACSDATVVLRALLLPSRLWFDVALLVPQATPVLVLRHIVVASSARSEDDICNGDRYVIVSGSTDGTVTLWDLTDTIHGFMRLVSETQPHMVIDCQKRPKTGRGSQGGRRRWRSLANSSFKKGNKQALLPCENNNLNTSCVTAAESSHETSGAEESEVIDTENTTQSTQSCDVPELQPMQTFSSVHQSGVNCLHVSEMERECSTTGMSSYCIMSGGDDQALQSFVFTLRSPQQGCSTNTASLNSPGNDALKILCQHTVPSAHSSAVKGIWTDGIWAFSTGLDQRIRCWKLDISGKFTEYSHVFISVPEPETLDVYLDRGKMKYHIAVAGRGMQMVEFSPPEDKPMERAW